MADDASKAELKAEVERLRAALRREEQSARQVAARADANCRVLQLTGYVPIRVQVDDAGAIESIRPASDQDEALPIDRARLKAQPLFRWHVQQVLQTGKTARFELMLEGRDAPIRVALVADPETSDRCLWGAVREEALSDHGATGPGPFAALQSTGVRGDRFRSALLANLTHEVRTPLTVILGFTSMLRRGLQDRYHRFIHIIERSGRRLLLMLDTLMDLAQLEADTLELEPESCNVLDVVQSTAMNFASLAESKNLTLNIDLPSVTASAHLDPDRFERVITHLIDNAIKFTEEGSITVSATPTDDAVLIQVRDTGVGIEPAFMPHIFEAFAQESEGLSRTHQGSGIGLHVAERLIERMGGQITVESQKGRGSVFTVMVPCECCSEPAHTLAS